MHRDIIRVGIVDDHTIVRTSLRQYLGMYPDIKVVGEAATGREAIDLATTTEIDVLVMDLSMPGQSGVDVMNVIKAKAPHIGILILSGYPEEQYAVVLIKQGASGYLNKVCDLDEVLAAVRAIGQGKRYISSSVAQLMVQELKGPETRAPHEQLSSRELQVFLKLAQGVSPVDIARSLSLSTKTVSTYRGRVMDKLSLSTNSELTYYAIKHKLIS